MILLFSLVQPLLKDVSRIVRNLGDSGMYSGNQCVGISAFGISAFGKIDVVSILIFIFTLPLLSYSLHILNRLRPITHYTI